MKVMTHGAGRSAGGERADLRARLVSQGEGTLAGRRGLLRCVGSGQLGRGGCLLGWRALRARDRRVGSSGRGGQTRAAARRNGR